MRFLISYNIICFYIYIYIHICIYTFPETNSSHLGRDPKGKDRIPSIHFQVRWILKGKDRIPSIFPFSGAMDVSFRECIDGHFFEHPEKRDQTVV